MITPEMIRAIVREEMERSNEKNKCRCKYHQSSEEI
jgi:hypothetical protein